MKALTRIVLAMSLASCGLDPSAGKTTTTGNGVLPENEDGAVAMRCSGLASHGWDTLWNRPVDTVRLAADARGRIDLGEETWAFVEIRDSAERPVALLRRSELGPGDRNVRVSRFTTRSWIWRDHGSFPGAFVVVDSSFQRSTVAIDGSVELATPSTGSFGISVSSRVGQNLTFGLLKDGAFSTSMNLIDAKGPVPLLMDDFEGAPPVPRLASSWPGTARWHLFPKQATLRTPTGTDSISVGSACRYDSARGSRAFAIQFAIDSSTGYVAAQLGFPAMDLSSRGSVCFGYRSDRRVKVEFLGAPVDSLVPGFSAYVPARSQWSDTCLSIDSLQAQPQNGTGQTTWTTFAKAVRQLQFLATSGSTYMGLDAIELDRR